MSENESKKDDLVADLYLDLIRDLKTRLMNGETSPQDRKLIAQIAKEHGVQVDITHPNNPLTGHEDGIPDLPFTLDDLTVDAIENE